MTGTWITDERYLDRLRGASGELDRQAADEATEKALDNLLAYGVVEDMQREDAKGFKTLATRRDKRWRMKDGDWKMKVRFVGREYKWAEHREDLFSSGATHSAWRRSRQTQRMLTTRLLSTKKWWWNLRRSSLNDLPKLEGTQTSCGV